MKSQSLCIALALLIINMPICFATELRLTYDSNGNLITGDGKYRVYNSLNQLWRTYQGNSSSGTLLEELTYHPIEERVLMKKVYDSGSLKKTVYYLDDNYVREINSTGTVSDFTYVYHEGSLVAQQIPGSIKQYPLTDHKGDIVTLTDSSGKTIENTTYSPFGEVTGGGELSRYGYESKEHQADCGYIPQTGLISYYSFDVDASDKMGHFNGLANGTLLSSTAILGKSYYFDGSSNNYISINKSVIKTRAFTISFWENADYAPSTSMMLVCDSNYVQNLQIYRYTSSGMYYETSVGYTSTQSFSMLPPQYQSWKHIVLTENSTGGVKVYVNAVLSDSYVGSNFTKLQSNLYLGLRGDLQRDYKGYIDELAIWNRTLTSREVQSLYKYAINFNKCQAKSTDYHFRSYTPETAQFTQPDTVIQNVYDPQLLNRYAFERNNPYRNKDRTGHTNEVFEPEPADYAELVNRYLTMFGLLPSEQKKVQEDREYEKLYYQYETFNPSAPESPYVATIHVGGILTYDRRISLEWLREWNKKTLKALSIDYYHFEDMRISHGTSYYDARIHVAQIKLPTSENHHTNGRSYHSINYDPNTSHQPQEDVWPGTNVCGVDMSC